MAGKRSLRYAGAADMPRGMALLAEQQGKLAPPPRMPPSQPPVVPNLTDVVPRRPNKFGAVATWVDGIRFDSKKEATRYQELELQRRANAFAWFTMQVPFRLEGGVRFVIDFMIVHHDGRIVLEDVKSKGTMLQTYVNKKKQLKARYGLEVIES